MNAWHDILALAESDSAALAEACRGPRSQQSAFLMALMRANASTAFGQEHDFASIDGVEAFRHAVPVRSYTELESWIQRIAEGESAVLTRDPVVAFEETSGTSAGNKLIPYTAASLAAFRSAILPWLSSLAQRRPGITRGPAYVAVSPLTRERRTLPCGMTVGLSSEAAYLGPEAEAALAGILCAPSLAPSLRSEHPAALRAPTQTRDLAFISVWSPTFLLEMLDGLPGDVDTQALWPQLDTISMWTDGASAPFAMQVAERFPHVHIDAKGLLSTESAITTRIDSEPGCIPALTSAFLEFVDSNGGYRLCDEVSPGDTYRVVITTPGGLYRYDTADQVRCVSVTNNVPRLQFIGRAGVVSDLVGEKLTDEFVARAFEDLAHLGLPAALVPSADPKPHYELWIDSAETGGGDGEGGRLSRSVDERLRANTQYAYARDLGQLRPPVVLFRPGFTQHRRHVLVARGARLGDVKPASLILDRSTLPEKSP